jgi:carbonic anhydrase
VYTDPWVREIIATNDPSAPGGPWKPGALAWAESLAYQAFIPAPGKDSKDVSERERVERSVKLDVEYLRMHSLIKETVKISGWVFDLHTGKVESLDC